MARKYIIQKGDTLSQIARRLKINIDSLARMNAIKDKNKIFVGQELKLEEPRKPLNLQVADALRPEPKSQIQRSQEDLQRTPTMNPRGRAIKSRTTAGPVKSRGLMARSQKKIPVKPETKDTSYSSLVPSLAPVYGGLAFADKALQTVGVNTDPIKIALQQAQLSLVERFKGKDSELAKALSKDITEKDLNTDVVKAMRDGAVKMFREGKKSLDYVAQGTTRPGDIFETGAAGFLDSILSPSKAASYTTGETSRGAFTLDKNNNLILNDVYDFPDVAESAAYGPKGGTYLKVHNLFEPRGTTGEEGFTSGLFAVSPQNTRKMTINLGKAPKDIIKMLQPQYIASAGTGSTVGGGG
tara:strand:- start:560 stop:1624 length:1065 start_codon:yes stop_codon:yes gene_type:complete